MCASHVSYDLTTLTQTSNGMITLKNAAAKSDTRIGSGGLKASASAGNVVLENRFSLG